MKYVHVLTIQSLPLLMYKKSKSSSKITSSSGYLPLLLSTSGSQVGCGWGSRRRSRSSCLLWRNATLSCPGSRLRLCLPCHVLAAEKADSDHHEPTRCASKAPQEPAERHEHVVLPPPSVNRVELASIFFLELPLLFLDDVDYVVGCHCRHIQRYDV